MNFATSKNLIFKSKTFPHSDIGFHKQTWTSPDGLTHNQYYHILIDTRRHFGIIVIRSFRGADCDSDHYLVNEKLKEKLSVAKRVDQTFHRDRFNVTKLKDEEMKIQYQVQISNTCSFEVLRTPNEYEGDAGISDTWENITDTITVAAGESTDCHQVKKKKPRFDDDFSN